MNWFEILKAAGIRQTPGLLLARKLIMPYIQDKIKELPLETLTLPPEGQSYNHFRSETGRRVTGHFFNDVEVNTWAGETECQALTNSDEEWGKIAFEELNTIGQMPYPYNQDPLVDGGQCNIQAAEFIMEAIVNRLPDHNVHIDVTPLGWQGNDRIDTRLESDQPVYQCGFKYQYTPSNRSKLGGAVGTGNVQEKDDEDGPLW